MDFTLEDGQTMPDFGGITAIHTPGNMCRYLNRFKTLFSGDALNARNGVPSGPNPGATADIGLATKSLKKLTALDVEAVICYHGGFVASDVNERIPGLPQMPETKRRDLCRLYLPL